MHRAQRHVRTLQSYLSRIFPETQTKTVPFLPEVDDHGVFVDIVWRIGFVPDIPQDSVAPLIGDALNNYRAALDHLAWVLVQREGTPIGKLKPRERRQVAFPLARSSGTFPSAFKRNLPGIDRSSPIGLLIERWQPYQPHWQNRALKALRDLSDRDKHRLLVVAFFYPTNPKFDLDAPGFQVLDFEILVRDRRPVKTGTPVVRTRLASVSMHNPKVELRGSAEMFRHSEAASTA